MNKKIVIPLLQKTTTTSTNKLCDSIQKRRIYRKVLYGNVILIRKKVDEKLIKDYF